MEQTRIGQLLLEGQLISEEQLKEALSRQVRTGRKLGSTLVEMGFIDENVLATFLSMQTGVPCVSLQNVFPSPAMLDLIPKELARRTSAIPLKRVDDVLHVAMADPTDARVLDELGRAAGLRIAPLISPATAISRALDAYYPKRGRPSKPAVPSSERSSDVEETLLSMERAISALSRSMRRLRKDMQGRRSAP